MKAETVYSIGHGNKKIEDFIAELQSFGIQYLLDVRSKPFSKWNPQYNQNELKFKLEDFGIKYVFVGDQLGGLPEDRSCYNFDGKVVYDLIKEKEFFQDGISRIAKANDRKIKIALMCSETKPEECHRSKLIGQELLKNDISINHIVSAQKTKSQQQVMMELTKGLGVVNLFGEIDLTSRKTY